VLNSGTGEFGEINLESGAFQSQAFLPSDMRGLCFVGIQRFAPSPGLDHSPQSQPFPALLAHLDDRHRRARNPAAAVVLW
jgi:hypothetical protein